MADYQQVVLP